MNKPTQTDVARYAGVSRATVSYVINGLTDGKISISDETRQRVLDAVTELGYIPDARAQSLASGDTKTIGIVIPDVHNPHFWEVVDGVGQEARASGYKILLSETAPDNQYAGDIFKDLSHRRIDGLILVSTFIDQSEEVQNILNQLLKQRLTIVELSDHHNLNRNVDRVVSDYRAVTVEVMAHLLSLQHKRIGLIYGVAKPELGEDRLQPYQESLQAAGLPVDQSLIITCGTTIEDGYQAARKVLEQPERPTALLAINDLLAIGALRAAEDLGLNVPDDLSIAGYDDIPMSKYLKPRLTTASKDAVRAGREATKLLIARLNDPDRPCREISIPSRLVKRESIAMAPY